MSGPRCIPNLNPVHYYEQEIEAYEAGCSYLSSVEYGIEGAGVAATDVAGIAGLARGLVSTVAEGDSALVLRADTSHFSGMSRGTCLKTPRRTARSLRTRSSLRISSALVGQGAASVSTGSSCPMEGRCGSRSVKSA